KDICAQELTAVSDPDIVCTLAGLGAGAGESCETARSACLDNASTTGSTDSVCGALMPLPATCTATVDDLASCTNGLLDILSGLSCSSSLTAIGPVPSACTTISNECRGIVNMPAGSAPPR